MNRKPETDEDLINRLATLLENEDDEQPIEEVDEELRAAGLDPEAVGARLAAIAAEASRDSPLDWRQRARRERAEAEERFRERSGTQQAADREGIVASINAIVARSPELGSAARVQAHFRNFEEATVEDLADLLSELRFLEETASEEE